MLTIAKKILKVLFQVIGLRALPIYEQLSTKWCWAKTIRKLWCPNYSRRRLDFANLLLKEKQYTIDTLKDELDGIVLNGGTIDTKNTVNMESKTGLIIKEY